MKDKILSAVRFIGLGFLEPLIRLISGEEPKKNAKGVFNKIILPVVTIFIFLWLWNMGAQKLYDIEADWRIAKANRERGAEAAEEERKNLYPDWDARAEMMKKEIQSKEISAGEKETLIAKVDDKIKYEKLWGIEGKSVATLPRPAQVWAAYKMLKEDWERIADEKDAFNKKMAKINAARKKKDQKPIVYTGRPSFIDQIKTSLFTVGMGFLLALLIAVPVGITLGLSETLRASTNWVIQIFKPVSPVVWLLLVFMVVKTVTKTDVDEENGGSASDLAFVISFISVGLCSMWATLVNTAVGVSSVDQDYLNVAAVMKLNVGKKIIKVVLPASIPLIFTGLRITVSVSWMVLIAIELLAQSPGLGSFVWEEFQNGASVSNAKIIVAMFVIGIIGFLLDRVMVMLQGFVSFTKEPIAG